MSVRPESTHGGALRAAARRYGNPESQWLDLSTGINPHGWPVPALGPEIWRRLPEPDDGLDEAGRTWAGAPSGAGCLPVPGTQAAIQHLPLLRGAATTGVPVPGYDEHARWWRAVGHRVVGVHSEGLEDQLEHLDVLVWIHPNNPTGEQLPRQVLRDWHQRLARRGGWLVVDEAFLDDPAESMAAFTGEDGLIVLQSLGKLFGLAGARTGLVLGPQGLCEQLEQSLGPWAVSSPTRAVMMEAVKDEDWQHNNRQRLRHASARLKALLADQGLPVVGQTLLFAWCPTPEAGRIAEALARQGILVRFFDEPPALRFGLPGDEDQWQRLEHTLDAALHETR
jgi:cobalamin biosynthetic protein CobC